MKKNKPNLLLLLKPYIRLVLLLTFLSIGASGLGLILPRIISKTIDAFISNTYDQQNFLIEFGITIISIYILTYLQSIIQTFASERVARDLRQQFIAKVSRQKFTFIEQMTASKLLTNLTTDINSIKMFIGQALATLISSLVIIIGASGFLLSINWKLALLVLTIIPIIGVMFFVVLSRVKIFMKTSREIIDWLNKVISESILGSTLIRVLNLQESESSKFLAANTSAKDFGIRILKMFASLIPIVIFVSNLATIAILTLGGHFVISGTMSLGEFTAFNSYIALLIFPILVVGMMTNMMAQAAVSYQRISEVLTTKDPQDDGKLLKTLNGGITLKNILLKYGEKITLKNISFTIDPGSKVAIIGPTAAGKTQLLNVLLGLTPASSGTIKYDNHLLEEYESETLHRQIGFVFQDSILFNLSLRKNIAFGDQVSESALTKAIQTAELQDFIESLPLKLETIVSERGTSLSGGQKQRIMLARALAINPKILLLDDFTARLDAKTENKILSNITKNYPNVTLISVTQKIAAIEHYQKIIVLMEGELIAEGTHKELIESSSEYVQIFNSQQSTNHYE